MQQQNYDYHRSSFGSSYGDHNSHSSHNSLNHNASLNSLNSHISQNSHSSHNSLNTLNSHSYNGSNVALGYFDNDTTFGQSRNPLEMSFNRFQSEPQPSSSLSSFAPPGLEPRTLGFENRSPKIEADRWTGFGTTPSLAEALLETDQFLVSCFEAHFRLIRDN